MHAVENVKGLYSLYSFGLPAMQLQLIDMKMLKAGNTFILYKLLINLTLPFLLLLNGKIGKLLSGKKTLATYLRRDSCTDSQ